MVLLDFVKKPEFTIFPSPPPAKNTIIKPSHHHPQKEEETHAST